MSEHRHRAANWRKVAGSTCLLVVFAGASPAEPVRSQRPDDAAIERIDEVVRRTLTEDGTPSASVTIVLNGKLAYAAAFGEASLSPRVPATTQTRYQLASLSKSITAAALLPLEQDGKLSLDAPCHAGCPD